MKIWLVGLLALIMAVPPFAAEDEQFASDLVNLINAYRAANGAGNLTLDALMSQAAQGHSAWLEVNNKTDLPHNGANGSKPGDRCRAAGSDCRSENIALATQTNGWETQCVNGQCTTTTYTVIDNSAAGIFNIWRASTKGHNENMLNPAWTRIGIGKSGQYVTADFL